MSGSDTDEFVDDVFFDTPAATTATTASVSAIKRPWPAAADKLPDVMEETSMVDDEAGGLLNELRWAARGHAGPRTGPRRATRVGLRSDL